MRYETLVTPVKPFLVGDMVLLLSESEIEGVLTVGSLVKVEGYWQEQVLYAEEVEVK